MNIARKPYFSFVGKNTDQRNSWHFCNIRWRLCHWKMYFGKRQRCPKCIFKGGRTVSYPSLTVHIPYGRTHPARLWRMRLRSSKLHRHHLGLWLWTLVRWRDRFFLVDLLDYRACCHVWKFRQISLASVEHVSSIYYCICWRCLLAT